MHFTNTINKFQLIKVQDYVINILVGYVRGLIIIKILSVGVVIEYRRSTV